MIGVSMLFWSHLPEVEIRSRNCEGIQCISILIVAITFISFTFWFFKFHKSEQKKKSHPVLLGLFLSDMPNKRISNGVSQHCVTRKETEHSHSSQHPHISAHWSSHKMQPCKTLWNWPWKEKHRKKHRATERETSVGRTENNKSSLVLGIKTHEKKTH